MDDNLDNHKAEFENAIQACDEKGYRYAISNPFFEIWLLLHHDDVNEEDRKYAVTEIQAPEGYEINENSIVIEFRADGEHEFTIENKKIAKMVLEINVKSVHQKRIPIFVNTVIKNSKVIVKNLNIVVKNVWDLLIEKKNHI